MNKNIIVAMGVVYRWTNTELEFLVIRRVPDDGGFWQPVTGGLEAGEIVRDAMIREVGEETGLYEHLHVSEVLHRREWGNEEQTGVDVVHAVEVPHSAEVALSDEHDAHEWLPLEKALEKLKYEGNKDSVRRVHDYALGRSAQG